MYSVNFPIGPVDIRIRMIPETGPWVITCGNGSNNAICSSFTAFTPHISPCKEINLYASTSLQFIIVPAEKQECL